MRKALPVLFYLALIGLLIVVMTVGYALWWMSQHHPDQLNALGAFLFDGIYFLVIILEITCVLLVLWLLVHIFNKATVVHRGDVVVIRTRKGYYHASATHMEAAHPREQFKYNIRQVEADPPKQIQAPIVQRQFALPPAYDMLSIYKQHDLEPDNLFLAKDGYGEIITTESDNLCHGVFNSMTGGGKTSVERDLISQLLYVGETVILADLKFAPITEQGLDWRPLAKKIMAQPPLRVNNLLFPCLLRNEHHIATLLHWLATEEIDRRLAMRVRGDFSYATYFVFVEELIALINIHPEAAADITRIVVLGRELRIFLFTAAQNFLVKDTKLSGGARENFQTAYFLGGDEHSGALLLDMTKKELGDYLRTNKVTLGKGVGMLRNNVSVPNASLVRLGWASNDSVYYLHGRADDFVLPVVGTQGKRESMREWGDEREYGIPYVHPSVQSTSYGQMRTSTVVTGELVNKGVKPPIEPSPISGESSENVSPVSPDERLQIITIAKTQLKIEGKVKRNEIPALMGKNKRYYPVVKQVLDEEGL